MIEWFEIAVKPHWPFMMAAVVFMVIGQVVKGSIFTRARAYAVYEDQLPSNVSYMPGRPRVKRQYREFWWWCYKTLPLHPVATGALLGLVITEPEPGIVGAAASLYFAGAGALSVFLYQVIKGFAKRQEIILADLPGQSAGYALRPTDTDKPLPRPPAVPKGLLHELNADDQRPTHPARKRR
jgi:hypothetical protein